MINLIFPPIASPSCVPLGVSFLKSHIDTKLGLNKLVVTDLNISFWNYLTDLNNELISYKQFVKGESGPFLRRYYEPQLPAQQILKRETDLYLDGIRKWLDKEILSNDVLILFNYLLEQIPNNDDPIMFSCLFPDQLLFTLGFTKWVNTKGFKKIYIGGASVLIVDPIEFMELAPWIDGVFTGEGEISIELFIKDGNKAVIPGLYKRVNGTIINEKQTIVPAMNELSIPDFSWTNLNNYFNPEPVLPVQFSRGCKWRRCRFCAHNFSFGKYRCLTPSRAVDMLQDYGKAYGAKYFYVTDQYLDAEFLQPFATEILNRNLSIRYTFMGRPAEDMTKDLLVLLSRSGCRWISWGVESGNARLLDIAQKGTNPKEVSRVLKDSSDAGIRNQALMIFGLPGSNDFAAEETYNFLQENRDWIHSHTASEFQLYKGTPFGNNPEKYGLRVTGVTEFCRINGVSLQSVKREYTMSNGDEPEVLRGPLESRKWKRLGVWVYPDNFWNSLPSEHYLILSAMELDQNNPDNPIIDNRVS
ncbi:MAG: radical SAM protein [Spirochaetales bacterium]|nr:radical SAM protein [Spirochaetales bacterium]